MQSAADFCRIANYRTLPFCKHPQRLNWPSRTDSINRF